MAISHNARNNNQSRNINSDKFELQVSNFIRSKPCHAAHTPEMFITSVCPSKVA